MFPELIKLLYFALKNNDVRSLIVKSLKAFLKNPTLLQAIKAENSTFTEDELEQPYIFANPKILLALRKVLTPNELKTFNSAINSFTNLSAFEPKEFKQLKGLNQKVKNSLDKNEIYPIQWEHLSSSWFKQATYYKTNKNSKSGLLTCLFQSDNDKHGRWYGPYVYPAFPEEVWLLMVQAKGKNGTGAGSVFWKYFLYSWLPSNIRTYTKKHLKKSYGITTGDIRSNIIQWNKYNKRTFLFINQLERRFYRLKSSQALGKTDIGSPAYQAERQRIVGTIQRFKAPKSLKTYPHFQSYQTHGQSRSYKKW